MAENDIQDIPDHQDTISMIEQSIEETEAALQEGLDPQRVRALFVKLIEFSKALPMGLLLDTIRKKAQDSTVVGKYLKHLEVMNLDEFVHMYMEVEGELEAEEKPKKRGKKKAAKKSTKTAKAGKKTAKKISKKAVKKSKNDDATADIDPDMRKEILDALSEGAASKNDIAAATGIDKKTINKIIPKMRDAGDLERVGMGPGTKWKSLA